MHHSSTPKQYIDSSNIDLFSCRRLPARLLVQQVAFLLNFQVYEIIYLVRAGLLRPLGNPAKNGRKYFCAAEIEMLARNQAWLDKASRVISKSIYDKNRRAEANREAELAVGTSELPR